jgi:hypothetical protein
LGKDNGVCNFYGVYGFKGSEFRLRLENKNRKGQVIQIKVNSEGQTKEVPKFYAINCHQKGHATRHCPFQRSPLQRKNNVVNVSRENKIALIGAQKGEVNGCWQGHGGANITVCFKILNLLIRKLEALVPGRQHRIFNGRLDNKTYMKVLKVSVKMTLI